MRNTMMISSTIHSPSPLRTALILALLVALGSGCVSTETHTKALSELEATRKTSARTAGELEELKKKSAADLQGAQAELDKTRQQLAALRLNLTEEQQNRQTAESTVAQLKGEIQQALQRTDDLQTKLTAESSQAAALRDETQRLLSGTTTAQAEIARLQNRAGELEAEAARIAQEREQLRKGQELLNASLEQERQRLKAEEAEKATLEQERAAKEEEIRRLTRTQEELSKSLQDEIAKGNITIQQVRDRLTINMVDRVLFDSGQAQVKPEGLKVLKQVSDILNKITDKQIRIEGHTDNVPIGTKLRDRFPTNWELSTARATSVVRYLIEQGSVDRKQLSAVGYADTHPQATNETDEGRTSNRRIEIVLYPKDLGEIAGQLKTEPR